MEAPPLVEDRWSDTAEPCPAHAPGRRSGRLAGVWRGRPDDPAWVRPSVIGLLVATTVLYLWGLGASGWGNAFYSAAVEAGSKSWKAFLFGSFDQSNFITVDKSPGALWVMDISARLFGVDSWSILAPQALEGVATVGFLYLAVRRWFTPAAGLLAGAGAALTPVAVLMFRFNNPDSLMVLLVTVAAYATVRYIDDSRARWMVLAGSAVGFAFLAKMLEAFVFVPAFALVVLVAGSAPVRSRLLHLLYGGAALVASAGWWLLAVTLTPAADRPYIGGSQNNSIWNLMFGYNGFGRLDGYETGSAGGGGGGAGAWGPTGLTRLFGAEMGTQASWLIPAALVLLVAGLVLTWRAPRTNRTRAGFLLWGGWLLLAGLTISLGQGIIHPYYTVALAPAIGGLLGAGTSFMWANRERWLARGVLAAAIAVTGFWSLELLGRTPSWLPWLRPLVVGGAVIGAVGVLLWPYLTAELMAFRSLTAAVALIGVLGGPFAYSLDTADTAHSGALPTAGPNGSTSGGGPGGPGGRAGRFGPGAGGFPGAPNGGAQNLPGGQNFSGGQNLPGTQNLPGGQNRFGGAPGGGFPGSGTAGSPGRGGGAGGLLNASTPSAALKAILEKDASSYTWVAATIGSNEAAGYQLATGDAVMAIGGFNGTDPYPTLAYFEKLVSAGRVHYFIAAASGGGGGPGVGASSSTSAITSWVEAHFTSSSVGGVTVYDLTAGSGS